MQKRFLLSALSVIMSCAALAAQASSPETASASAAQDAPLNACGPSGRVNALFSEFGRSGRMPAELGRWLNDPAIQIIEPYQAFDNVYNVGICWVSAWLIKTSAGLVLIDSLYEPYTGQLLRNIEKLGFRPADVRMVLLTHGHFDHVGGVTRLKSVMPSARFVMSRGGWEEARADARASAGKPNAWTMPASADTYVGDGDVLTLGDTAFHVIATPGHTWGTTSYAFDVKDGASSHHAITIGGLGLNAIDGPAQVEAYLGSVARLKRMVDDPRNPLAVHLTAHPFSTGLTETRARLAARKPGEPHPLVDAAALRAQLDELGRGARERLLVERQKAGENTP